MSQVNHPKHYGGADNPHEPIKVIEHYDLGFHVGNTIKYILRAGKKGSIIEDLEKAAWYLQRRIDFLKDKKEAEKKELEMLEKSNPKAA